MQILTKNLRSFEIWLYSLVAAFIGGAATAITAQTGLATAQACGMDVKPLNWDSLGIVALSAGIYACAAYLKQSPLPKFSTGDTQFYERAASSVILPDPPAYTDPPKTP